MKNTQLPNLDIENTFYRTDTICGIDEVGRGALAGPVVAAAVVLDLDNIPKGINDSKKLSKSKRNLIYDQIKNTAKDIGIGEASEKEIDNINILQASLIAMSRAFNQLIISPKVALVDGNFSPQLPCKIKNIIQGDTKSISIAAASIIAKVYRDKLLTSVGKNFPKYNFKNNSGYGTKEHYAAINSFGITIHHRKSFKLIK